MLTHAATVVEMAAEEAATESDADAALAPRAAPLRVLCVARDETDRLGHRMLQLTLDPRLFDFEICSSDLLVSETVERIARKRADVVCIGSTPPGPAQAAKLLCRRLRKRFPHMQIIVARWCSGSPADFESLRAVGASEVYTAIDQLRLTLIAAAASRQTIPGAVVEKQDSMPAAAAFGGV